MRVQIEQLDLLDPWPALALRDGCCEMRILVGLGAIPLGQIATRPRRRRVVSHGRLRQRIARELGDALIEVLAREGMLAGPEALTWFMPEAWGSFAMSASAARQRRAYLQERFLLPVGLASPLREWVVESQRREADWPLPAVTVALCTRDRQAMFEGAVAALRELDYPNFDILIVNNSSDAVPIEEIARRLGVACARCLAGGVSHARNAAIAHAKSPWIAFIDDNCRPEKSWLRELVREAQDSRCRAVLGQTVPARLESTAEIVLDMYERRTGQATGGANMLVNRFFAQQIGGFDVDLGAGPRRLGGGEDLELAQRIRRAGFKVEHAPRAIVHHHRVVTSPELRKLIRARASGHAAALVGRGWLRHVIGLVSEMRRALGGRGRYPLPLLMEEFHAAFAGPAKYAWLKLRRALQPALQARTALTLSPTAPQADEQPTAMEPKLAA